MSSFTDDSGIRRISSGSRFEPVVGYSRAVVAGPFVEVAGTTAPAAGDTVYAQTRGALEIIGAVLAEAGVGFGDVIRTRIYLTDISQWEECGRAHGEVFRDIRPVATMVEVTALIDPSMLVEVEVSAYRRPRS